MLLHAWNSPAPIEKAGQALGPVWTGCGKEKIPCPPVED